MRFSWCNAGDGGLFKANHDIKDSALVLHALHLETLELWWQRWVEVEGTKAGTVPGKAVGWDLQEAAMAREEGKGRVSVSVGVDVVVDLLAELVVRLAEIRLRGVHKVGISGAAGGGEVRGGDGEHGPGHGRAVRGLGTRILYSPLVLLMIAGVNRGAYEIQII